MSNTYNEFIERVLVSEQEIKEKVHEIATQINEIYKNSDKTLLLICILKGSIIFTADLMREITVPMEVDFMQASSYGSSTFSCGQVSLRLDLKTHDLENYNVLLVEDILDSGKTLSCIMQYLKGRGANDVKLCTLLDKPKRRVVDIKLDFEGIHIPDEFVVGYGLDYNEQFRNLPFVGILKREVYEK